MSLLLGTSVKKQLRSSVFVGAPVPNCMQQQEHLQQKEHLQQQKQQQFQEPLSATTEEQKYDVLVASDPASASGVIRSRSSCKDPASVGTLVSEASRDDHGQRQTVF